MRLIHYSNAHITEIKEAEQVGRKVDQGWKPNGLWVSAESEGRDDGWRDWCISEGFRTGYLTHPTEVVLAPNANVLRIDSVAALDAFHSKYHYTPLWARDFPAHVPGHYDSIDWRAVASEYDAIIIAPYIYERRLGHMMWYYTWDCASGCIWQPRAVADLRPLPVLPIPEQKEESAA